MLTAQSTSLSKRDIAGIVFDQHKAERDPVSRSQAGRIADKIIRGEYRPNLALAKAIGYADRTGENAIYNITRQGDTDYAPRYL